MYRHYSFGLAGRTGRHSLFVFLSFGANPHTLIPGTRPDGRGTLLKLARLSPQDRTPVLMTAFLLFCDHCAYKARFSKVSSGVTFVDEI